MIRSVKNLSLVLFIGLFFSFSNAIADHSPVLLSKKQAAVSEGILEGTPLASNVISFKGIPYAAPPIGELRWKAPQPALGWTGIKRANKFGARPIQDSNLLYEFRSEEMSEDCLYLNVWTPGVETTKLKPVYIFIHGGSFIHGDGSQPAYDGENMAKQGIVYVSINYRLGVFGFLSHPDLSKESAYGGSGNYGLLDQAAAFRWVKENIAAFGGDPNRITIGGESVGAQSVSAHMTSPQSKGLFHAAIAESGSLLDVRTVVLPLKKSEDMGVELSVLSKATTIKEMRLIPARKLLKLVEKGNPRRFRPVVDGYFLREDPAVTFKAGKQAKVPLLVGWNAQEVPAAALFRLRRINTKNYKTAVEKIYGDNAAAILDLYPAGKNAEVKKASSELMSDRLINYSSWKLAEQHAKNEYAPVYRYLFAHPHPGLNQRTIREGNFFQVILKRLINKMIAGTAFHASEIEYALGNLDVQDNYAWDKDDHIVSAQMLAYFSNFIKTGNPNNPQLQTRDLTIWPKYEPINAPAFMRIGVNSKPEKDTSVDRFMFFDNLGKTE